MMRYEIQDEVIKEALECETDDVTDITVSVDDDEVSLNVGPRDWQWNRKTGELVGSGTCVAPRASEVDERKACRKLLEERGFERCDSPLQGGICYARGTVVVTLCGCGSWSVFVDQKARPSGKDWDEVRGGGAWVRGDYGPEELTACLDGLKPSRGAAHVA